MSPHTRRAYLASLAAVATASAGCLGNSPGTTTETQPSSTRTTGTQSTSTAGPTSLDLEVVEDPTSLDAPLTVYPRNLQHWLRQAATGDGPLRLDADAFVYAPRPLLPSFEYVRLSSPSGDVDGVYEVNADGGIRYRLLVGVDAVASVPEDATVTDVSNLSASKRSLATKAVAGDPDARVYPETELGEWTRTEFFGGYFRLDDEVYVGKEVQQTDAAFFSEEAWYVLSLSSVSESEASDPVALSLPEIDQTVRRVVDPMLEEWSKDDRRVSTEVEDVSDAVRSFAADAEYLLTHTTAFSVET